LELLPPDLTFQSYKNVAPNLISTGTALQTRWESTCTALPQTPSCT